MRFISEEPETPRQRDSREKLENAGVFKSKEEIRREKERSKEVARNRDYEQKQKTLEYKRERLKWQQERSAAKDKLGQGGGGKEDIIKDKDKDPTAYKKAISNVVSIGSDLVSSGIAPAKDVIQKIRNRKKAKEGEKARKGEFNRGLEKEFKKREIEKRGGTTTKESFSCWREEFLYELGEMRRTKKDKVDVDKKIDVMKGTNKIIICPKIQEQYITERKRDHLTNALFAISFAANATQSPEALVRSGHIEGPSMQLMSKMMSKRKKATVSGLDNARVSHPARNIKKSNVKEDNRLQFIIRNIISEAKEDMKCNKPSRAPKGAKQKYVVKACDSGEDKTLRFGYRGMQDFLQHKDPKRRANFKARHNCSDKKDKLTPGWWACNYSW